MDIKWLQDFLALADSGNFTQAASRRSVSQAAFSRRIQSLERWLGVELVKRGSVPIYLTTEGLRFESEARHILGTLFDSRASLLASEPAASLPVRISMSHVIASYRFAPWWSQWNTNSSLCAITKIDNINDVVSDFITGNSDVLLCHRAESLPIMIDSRHVISHVLGTEKLLPCIASNTTQTFNTHDSNGIGTAPLVMYRPGAYFAGLLENLLEQSSMQLLGQRVVESEMSHVIADCVSQGLGIGWIPECVLQSPQGKNLQIINEPSLIVNLEIVAFAQKNKRSYASDLLWQKICAAD